MLETALSVLGPFAPVGVLVFRNLYGWVNEAAKDGKFESYEWKLLVRNIVGLGSFAVLLTLGVPSLSGVDATALTAVLDAARNDIVGPLFKKK